MIIKIKRNKEFALALTLLILAYIAPLCIAAQNTEQPPAQGENKYPEVPGVPDNVVQYNKTDAPPVGSIEQIQAGEPALFQCKNMTMLMNCTKNCQVVFTADPEVTPKLLGLSIEPNQTMTLTMNMYRSPLQGELIKERNLNFYLGIEPNAEQQLKAQIRLHINQTELNQELNREVNIAQLAWMYWNQTQTRWVAVESFMNQDGYLVCNTDHFSTWTVAEVNEQAVKPTDVPIQENNQLTSIYIAGILFAVIIVVVVLAVVKKCK